MILYKGRVGIVRPVEYGAYRTTREKHRRDRAAKSTDKLYNIAKLLVKYGKFLVRYGMAVNLSFPILGKMREGE